MKLIVGLGNPGRKYAGTRHNVGFDALDVLAERHRLDWESGPAEALIAKWRIGGALLAKPLTFMNLSGHPVGELLRFFKIDPGDLLVIVDDVALDVGRLRARPSGSAGGHNGLKSLIGQLGSDTFARLRVGVGRRRCPARSLGSCAGEVRAGRTADHRRGGGPRSGRCRTVHHRRYRGGDEPVQSEGRRGITLQLFSLSAVARASGEGGPFSPEGDA